MRRNASGFTLIEILMVVGILTLLMGLLLGAIFNSLTVAKVNAAKMQAKTLSISMTSYIRDWGSAPPFDPAMAGSKRAGAELLYETLCVPHAIGERRLGPYYNCNESSVQRNASGKAALISPLNGFYTFGFEGRGDNPSVWVLVDPGLDKLLGGSADEEKGFIPDGSDANGDGKADALDNIVEKISLH